MKLAFSTVTLGGGPNYFLGDRTRGLDAELINVTTDIPRTDYSKRIDGLAPEKVRAFTGTLVGNNEDDFRTKRRDFTGFIDQTFTFTLTDDYGPTGSETTFATYEFIGTIIESSINNNTEKNTPNSGTYTIQIYSEDPVLGLLPAIDELVDIDIIGWTFPLVFPFILGSEDNSVTVVNAGNTTAYPTITLTGGGVNFTIVAEDSPLTNNQFKYNAGLGSGNQVILTPIPSDPIKARKDGASVISLTNENFEALEVLPGSNTFTFFVDSGIDASTKARIQFNSAFKAI